MLNNRYYLNTQSVNNKVDMVKTNNKINKIALIVVAELAFLALIIGIDLYSKWAAVKLLGSVGSYYEVWKNVIDFRYVRNYGASFGSFTNQSVLLLTVTIVVCTVIFIFLYWKPFTSKYLRFSLLMIAGGAIGNLIDRAALGYVRDFIDYKFLYTWFGIDFAIGNIADLFCIAGVLLFIIYAIFIHKEGDISKFFKRNDNKKKRVTESTAAVNNDKI